ncbi:MAG: hypothetical protein E7413_04845 [Ruminococcaceae bacterium]|nr:hypothetical protein [Oscillospiraceae bacterium]
MMKKMRVFLVCMMALVMLLTACSKGTTDSEDAKKSTEKNPKSTAKAEPTPAETQVDPAAQQGEVALDYDVSVYDEVIAEVKNVLALPAEEAAPEHMDAIREIGLVYEEEAETMLCYQYKDVNQDQVPELLIGLSAAGEDNYLQNSICCVYTVVEGAPNCVLYGHPRSSYSLLSDGHFANFGSDGEYIFFGEFYLSAENQILCKDYYFTYESQGNAETISVYQNATGNPDAASSNVLDMTQDEFYELEEELALRTLPLTDATTFIEFE